MTDSRIQNFRVAIVILSLNQRDKTLKCLESLLETALSSTDIFVWDNGSNDGTAEAVQKQFPMVITRRHPHNLGVASGRNAAAKLANEMIAPTHLLFLDNDMTVEAGFVDELLRPFQSDTENRIGQCQAKLRLMHDPQRLNDGGGCKIQFWLGRTSPIGYGEIDRGQYDKVKSCVACGGAMMVRSDVFNEMGGFDTCFDPFGPEDLDFSIRLQKAGYEALYVPKAVAYHEVSQTFGEGEYTEEYAEYRSRHWFTFMRRHANFLQKLSFVLIGVPIIASRILIREGNKGNISAIKGLLRGLFAPRKKNDTD